MSQKKLLDYALARREEGWKIVLVRPKDKVGTSVRNATQAQIENHIQSGGNLGGIPPEDICIIDIDLHGADGYASLATLVQDYSVDVRPTTVTPTNGQHIFVEVPTHHRKLLKSKINLLPGVDILYKTLYAVFPFSVRDDGEYQLTGNGYFVNHVANEKFWAFLLSGKRDNTIDPWSEGSRNNTLFKEAIKIFDMEVDDDEKAKRLKSLVNIARNAAAKFGNFGVEEIKATIASAGRRHQSKVTALQDGTGSGVFSQAINAAVRRLLNVKSGDIVFVTEGLEYSVMTWHGDKWGSSESNLIAMILENEDEIATTALKANIITIEQKNKYCNGLRDRNKAKTIASFLIPEYINMKKNGTVPPGVVEVPDYKLNSHDNWIIFKNGGVHLDSGEVIPIEDTKPMYSTMTIDYDYNPDAKSELVDKLIEGKSEVLNAISRSLKGGPARDMGIILGETSTGKTTLFECIARSLQEYAVIHSMGFLSSTENPNMPDPNLISACGGTRVLLGSDVAGHVKLDKTQIKRIIGSETVITRALYEETRQYRISFTPFLSENTIPYTGLFRDNAVASRIKFVQCRGFRQVLNQMELEELKTVPHLQALSALLIGKSVARVVKWPEQEDFQLQAKESEYPEYILKLEDDYNIYTYPVGRVSSSDMYDIVKFNAGNVNRKTVTRNLSAYIKDKFGIELTRWNGTRVWKGLRVRLKGDVIEDF